MSEKAVIFKTVRNNWMGSWSAKIWLQMEDPGSFTCSAEEEVQEDGFSRDLPDEEGLQNGRDLYMAVAKFIDNYEIYLDRSDWLQIANSVSDVDQRLGADFLAAHEAKGA